MTNSLIFGTWKRDVLKISVRKVRKIKMIRHSDDPRKEFLTPEQRIELWKDLKKLDLLDRKLNFESKKIEDRKIVGGVLLSAGAEHLYCGAAAALEPTDCVWPDHRSHGVFLKRGVAPVTIFRQALGKITSPSRGRDGYMDFADYLRGLFDFISDMLASLAPATGFAFAREYMKKHLGLQEDRAICAVFFGDGAFNQGQAYEAMNFMSLYNLPIGMFCNDNSVAVSVQSHEETKYDLCERPKAFGIRTVHMDSKNIEDVYYTVKSLARDTREGAGPFFLHVLSVRTEGHNANELYENVYVSIKELRDARAQLPVRVYEQFLIERGILKPDVAVFEPGAVEIKEDTKISDIISRHAKIVRNEFVRNFEADYRKQLDEAWKIALQDPDPEPSRENVGRIFVSSPPEIKPLAGATTKNILYRKAIHGALDIAFGKYPNLVMFGEDVADPKGEVHGTSIGLGKKHGEHRVMNFILAENQIIGTAIGMALAGLRPIPVMEYSSFIWPGAEQLVQKAGTFNYLNFRSLPITVRFPGGGGFSGGQFHSSCIEPVFAHLPGFKIGYPATPYDAKGMLLQAIADENLVLFFESVWALSRLKGDVPDCDYTIPYGIADIKRPGSDITIILYGPLMLSFALDAANILATDGISAEIIDLRSFWGSEDMPFDIETCFASLKKTGRVIVLTESDESFGIGAEVASRLSRIGHGLLRAPIELLGALHTPVPIHKNLEFFRLPSVSETVVAAKSLMLGEPFDPLMWNKYVSETQEQLRGMIHPLREEEEYAN